MRRNLARHHSGIPKNGTMRLQLSVKGVWLLLPQWPPWRRLPQVPAGSCWQLGASKRPEHASRYMVIGSSVFCIQAEVGNQSVMFHAFRWKSFTTFCFSRSSPVHIIQGRFSSRPPLSGSRASGQLSPNYSE